LQTHGQLYRIFVWRRRKSYNLVIEVRSPREAYCDTDHYLVVATARERLSVRKRAAQTLYMDRHVVRKPSEAEVADK
jgi:hypothetical protein